MRIKADEKQGLYTVKFRIETFTVRESAEFNDFRGRSFARSSDDGARVARALFEQWDAEKEHFVVLCLNNKNRLSGYKHISTGSLTASLVHPREVFSAVITERAAAFLAVHNHPSGDPAPSPEDIDLTRRLKQCAELFAVRFLDHIVLGSGSYFSFNDRGML